MSKWYPISSHSFRVIIGNRKIGFSRISGIDLMKHTEEKSTSLTVLKPGCPVVNRVPGVKLEEENALDSTSLSQKKKGKVLTLEKALQPNKQNSNQEFLLNLMDRNVDIEEISIEILNDSRSVVVVLVFQKCNVISYHLSELDAISGDYIKQTIEIQYDSAVMRLPSSNSIS